MLFKFDIANFVWKNRWRGGRKHFFKIFVLVLSSFLSVKYFLKIWVNHFSLLTFKSFKPSLLLFLTIEGKRWKDLSFSLSARFEQLILHKSMSFSNSLFFFHSVITFYSLSSRPLPSWPLFLIVLHNSVKNIHVRKAWFVAFIGTENRQNINCKKSKI